MEDNYINNQCGKPVEPTINIYYFGMIYTSHEICDFGDGMRFSTVSQTIHVGSGHASEKKRMIT